MYLCFMYVYLCMYYVFMYVYMHLCPPSCPFCHATLCDSTAPHHVRKPSYSNSSVANVAVYQ